MPEVTAEDFNYSVEKIQEMAAWTNFQGFTADTCGKCKKTANLLAGGAGWFCPCGHFNVLPWSNMQIPHDLPDYGPPRECMRAEGDKGEK
jgi:hypothetical protein